MNGEWVTVGQGIRTWIQMKWPTHVNFWWDRLARNTQWRHRGTITIRNLLIFSCWTELGFGNLGLWDNDNFSCSSYQLTSLPLSDKSSPNSNTFNCLCTAMGHTPIKACCPLVISMTINIHKHIGHLRKPGRGKYHLNGCGWATVIGAVHWLNTLRAVPRLRHRPSTLWWL